MPIFDHFEVLAPFYERVIKARHPEQLIQLAGLPVDGALLDAGGGTGRISQNLAGYAGMRVVADGSLGMLAQAKAKDGLQTVCSQAEELPFANGAFDCVIMVDALHHVEDQAHTASEMWRVLKPGGRIVIEEPDIHKFSVKILAVAEKLALMRSRILSHERIRALFVDPAALVDVHQDGFTAWVVVKKGE